MDENDDSYGFVKNNEKEELIRLSDGFKEYIRNLADNN